MEGADAGRAIGSPTGRATRDRVEFPLLGPRPTRASRPARRPAAGLAAPGERVAGARDFRGAGPRWQGGSPDPTLAARGPAEARVPRDAAGGAPVTSVRDRGRARASCGRTAGRDLGLRAEV